MAAPVFATGDVPSAAQFNDWLVNIKYARKPANETLSSNTTVQLDDDLAITVASNAVYEIKVVMFIASQTTTDFKFGFATPAGATFDYIVNGTDVAGTGYTNATCYPWASGSPSGLAGLGGNTAPGMVDGLLVVGGTSGSFRLQWAQNTSGASGTTLLAGSYMIGRRVA
jgi:hypothetical protein